MARLAHWAARKTTPRTIRGLPARQTPKDIWSAPHDTNVAPDTMAATQTTPRRKTLDENLKMRGKASKTLQEAIEKQVNDFTLEGAKPGDHHVPRLMALCISYCGAFPDEPTHGPQATLQPARAPEVKHLGSSISCQFLLPIILACFRSQTRSLGTLGTDAAHGKTIENTLYRYLITISTLRLGQGILTEQGES
jgi:hypothetical protein